MESTRQKKISRLIQKELSDIFLVYARKYSGTLITITSVKISADLSVSHANISVFPSEKGEEVLEDVRSNASNIRYELGNKLRHQLRIIPTLNFHIDDTLDYLDRIDDLLKK